MDLLENINFNDYLSKGCQKEAVSCENYRQTKEQLIFVKVAKKWCSPSPIVHQLGRYVQAGTGPEYV